MLTAICLTVSRIKMDFNVGGTISFSTLINKWINTYVYIHVNIINEIMPWIWKNTRRGIWEPLSKERKRGNDVIILLCQKRKK